MAITTDETYKKRFSRFLRALLAGGTPPETIPGFGDYAELASALLEAWRAGGTAAVQRVFEALAIDRVELQVLASASLEAVAGKRDPSPVKGRYKKIASAPILTDELIRAGCLWLLDYMTFSRRWSPRSYEGYHPACGIWLLSTVAAGRIACHFGGQRKTPIFVALTSRTSKFAKTTAANVARQVLHDADLDWLLFADNEATPQKFQHSLVGEIPENYNNLSPESQARAERSFAFAGQKGWIFEEFGGLVAKIQAGNNYMSDYRNIFRWIDDNLHSRTMGTMGRGSEEIVSPYLSLLCNMTPDDLRGAAKRGAGMWGDGFWPRFAFVCPPGDAKKSRARFPLGRRETPDGLVETLQQWHLRLGEPEVSVQSLLNKKGEATESSIAERISPLPEHELVMGEAAFEAYYAYDDALSDISDDFDADDLAGNYARFPEKALRLALLFASLAGSDEIAMPHWKLAVAIVEQWRANLHDLIDQVNTPEPGYEEAIEEKILNFIERWRQLDKLPTRREIRQYVKGCSSEQLERMLRAMTSNGTLEEIKSGKKTYYRFPLEAEDTPPLDVSVEPDLVSV